MNINTMFSPTKDSQDKFKKSTLHLNFCVMNGHLLRFINISDEEFWSFSVIVYFSGLWQVQFLNFLNFIVKKYT